MKTTRRFCRIGTVAVVLVGALIGMPAQAAAKDKETPSQSQAPTVTITGFRSAQFGDSESQLLPKIAKDLGIDAKSITADTHPVERTRFLLAEAKNLLPDSGTASVAYILGATSKALMQVNVVWTVAPGDKAGLERVAATANALRDHLAGKGAYVKDGMALNARLPDGSILVFRGADAQGHMVALHLVVQPATPPQEEKKDDGTSPEMGAILRLSYMEKPGAPDVLKLAPSAF